METTTIAAIQEELKSRIPNTEHALLTPEGILYDLSLDESGLRDTPTEVSYCGITEKILPEYKHYDPSVPIASVRDIPTLGTVGAANFITQFYMWYFQKPPAHNFLALPKLLWNLVCNASLLAPVPVITYVQQLVGDPKPDGIWGSGTTQRVKDFFEGKTVAEIEAFGEQFTALICARYHDLGQHPEFAETCNGWIARANRKLTQMKALILENQPPAQQPAEPTPQPVVQPTPQTAQQPAEPTPQPVVQPTPQTAQQPAEPTPQQGVQPTPQTAQQPAEPTPQQGVQPTPQTAQQPAQPSPEYLQGYLETMKALTAALTEHNVLARELIELRKQEMAHEQKTQAAEPQPTEDGDDGGVLGAAAGVAKKALDVAEIATNPVGAAKDMLNKWG